LDNALMYEANTFSSTYFENTGEGLVFDTHYLPWQLQLSTLNAASIMSSTEKNTTKVMIGGNFYDCNIEMGRYDANFGNILEISNEGALKVKPLGKLRIDGQIRRIKKLKRRDEEVFLLGINDAPIQVISTN